MADTFGPLDFEASLSVPLDAPIANAVRILQRGGIETFESCQGGDGHAYPEPTVRFHGQSGQGFRALAVAMEWGLPVKCLRRVWLMTDHEPTGPCWEIVFRSPTTDL